MNHPNEQRKSKEVIVNGTAVQFRGLVEFEQRSEGHLNPNYKGSDRKVLPSDLYGPITGDANKTSSLYWLVVVNESHIFLEAYKRGEAEIIASGPFGRLELIHGVTLDEYDQEAIVFQKKILKGEKLRRLQPLTTGNTCPSD